MEKQKLTRKELYDLVWSTPLSRLANKYKISDNGLRKICKRMDIPLPPMGYWQKIKYKKRVTITKLKENNKVKQEVEISERGLEQEPDSPITILNKRIKEIEEDKNLRLEVPQKLAKPNMFIKSTIEYEAKSKAYFRYHRGSHPERFNVLSIDVDEKNKNRALRIMDSVIKLLIKRGHEVKIVHHTNYAVIEEEQVEFRIRERKTASEKINNWGRSERVYAFNGKFVFVIGGYNRKEIKDGTEPIELKLSRILAIFEMEGQRKKEGRISMERSRKEREEKERLARERQSKIDNEMSRFKDLFIQAKMFDQANYLREYLRKFEEQKRKSSELNHEIKTWLEWAKEKIDWYDPFIERGDELLSDNLKMQIYQEILY